MVVQNRFVDPIDTTFERRAVARTVIRKNALIYFPGEDGVRSCCVRDVTSVGAGLHMLDQSVVPAFFELTFDRFHTVRECRPAWREGAFVGVAFGN